MSAPSGAAANADINATRKFQSPEAQAEVRTLTDASVQIAAHIAAARFRDQVDTDPKVCAQIAVAAGTIAQAIISLAKKHIEVGITYK